MSIPGFTADVVTRRGSGGYRTGPGAPARGRAGLLPQGRAVRRAGDDLAERCIVRCSNRCLAKCIDPNSEQCDVCFSPCLDACMSVADVALL